MGRILFWLPEKNHDEIFRKSKNSTHLDLSQDCLLLEKNHGIGLNTSLSGYSSLGRLAPRKESRPDFKNYSKSRILFWLPEKNHDEIFRKRRSKNSTHLDLSQDCLLLEKNHGKNKSFQKSCD